VLTPVSVGLLGPVGRAVDVRARVAARRRGVRCIFADNSVCGNGLMEVIRKEDASVGRSMRKKEGRVFSVGALAFVTWS